MSTNDLDRRLLRATVDLDVLRTLDRAVVWAGPEAFKYDYHIAWSSLPYVVNSRVIDLMRQLDPTVPTSFNVFLEHAIIDRPPDFPISDLRWIAVPQLRSPIIYWWSCWSWLLKPEGGARVDDV